MWPNKNKILACTLLTILAGCSWFCKDHDNFLCLLEDMKQYRTTSKHRGDLWQHSVWTAQILGRWVRGVEQEPFGEIISKLVRPLSQREWYLLEVTGAVHDIGKAGDLAIEKYEQTERVGDIITYFSRENHERIGFEYIMHDIPSMHGKFTRSYQAVDGTILNFYNLLSKLGIQEDEQKLIAVLVGAHKTMSSWLLQTAQNSETAADALIDTVTSLVNEAHYDPRSVQSLLCMSLLVQLADIRSTFFPVITQGPSSLFDASLILPSPHLYPKENDHTAKWIMQFMPKAQQLIVTILARYEKESVN